MRISEKTVKCVDLMKSTEKFITLLKFDSCPDFLLISGVLSKKKKKNQPWKNIKIGSAVQLHNGLNAGHSWTILIYSYSVTIDTAKL